MGIVFVVPEIIKGSKEYWAVHFAATDLVQARQAVEQAGGSIVYHTYHTDLGSHLIARDDQGAAFTLTAPVNPRVDTTRLSANDGTQPQIKPALKWRAGLGLVGVYLIVLLEQDWAWGLLFLFWVIPDLKSRVTYFIEPITRASNPVLYWATVLTWLGLSSYLLITPLLG